jgi:major membrane immunogen (membrane-anchored lipoprotein)
VPKRNLAHLADNLIKHSNNIVNVVTKALNANAQSEPAHVRLREEAEGADTLSRCY